jgi:hypothetical protein
MVPYLGSEADGTNGYSELYDLLDGTKAALEQLLAKAKDNLPQEALPHISRIHFSTANTGSPYFPSPFKQTEAISALKAVEAGVAASIADLKDGSTPRKIDVDLERATAFLFSTYLATVGGMDKAHPKVKALLKGKSCCVTVLKQLAETRRYRSTPGSVYPVSAIISESVRDQEPWRVLPSSRLFGSDQSAEHDRSGRTPSRSDRLP